MPKVIKDLQNQRRSRHSHSLLCTMTLIWHLTAFMDIKLKCRVRFHRSHRDHTCVSLISNLYTDSTLSRNTCTAASHISPGPADQLPILPFIVCCAVIQSHNNPNQRFHTWGQPSLPASSFPGSQTGLCSTIHTQLSHQEVDGNKPVRIIMWFQRQRT